MRNSCTAVVYNRGMDNKAPSHIELSSSDLDQAIIDFTNWTQEAWFPHLGDQRMSAQASDLFVMSLGLGGEVGEVLEAVAKNDRALIKKELGDVIYYWGRLAQNHNLDVQSLLEVARENDKASNPMVAVLTLGAQMGRVQDVIKKGERDGGMDDAGFAQAMGKGLGCWLDVADLYEIEPVQILQGCVDKIISRHKTGKLRGSDTPDGDRVLNKSGSRKTTPG